MRAGRARVVRVAGVTGISLIMACGLDAPEATLRQPGVPSGLPAELLGLADVVAWPADTGAMSDGTVHGGSDGGAVAGPQDVRHVLDIVSGASPGSSDIMSVDVADVSDSLSVDVSDLSSSPPETVLDVPGPTSDITTPDTTPTPELVLAISGGRDGCRFDYRLPLLSTCPEACGRAIHVDASGSRDIARIAWRFSVPRPYVVQPTSTSGFETSTTLGFEPCDGVALPPFGPTTLTVEAALDGGPFALVATIAVTPRLVVSCPPEARAEETCPMH